jgi:hypothetical protein
MITQRAFLLGLLALIAVVVVVLARLLVDLRAT